MGVSVRYYIFEEGGALRRVPQRIVYALSSGAYAIPEYAGTEQHAAEVLLRNEGVQMPITSRLGSHLAGETGGETRWAAKRDFPLFGRSAGRH